MPEGKSVVGDVAPKFFATPAAWRKWLEKNHATVSSLVVGFYKTATGYKSITWPESVDGALCFGWIDGVRKRIDDESYLIRFTPRKKGSIWSSVNIKRVGELIADGLMAPAGLKAFEARTDAKSNIYAYEQRDVATLTAEEEAHFRSHTAAWEFFAKRGPSYRQRMIWWIVSAKQSKTRESRLAKLILISAAKQTL